MRDSKGYQAIVEKIISNGRHGSYAVARCVELGSVTFSLGSDAWEEDDWPEPGTCVMLYKLIKKRAGWRATLGRFVQPSDVESNSNQHSEGSNEQ